MPLDVVVLRLKSHGHRFEVPCRRARILEYMKSGRDNPLQSTEGVAVHPQIMANAHKRETSTHAALLSAFGATEFEPIALTIIQFGEVVEDEKERAARKRTKNSLVEEICALVPSLLRNKFTGVSPERDEVEPVLKDMAKTVHFVEGASVWPQAAWAARQICGQLECSRTCVKVDIVLPSSSMEEQWTDFFLDFDGVVVCRTRHSVERRAESDGETSAQGSSDGAVNLIAFSLLLDEAFHAANDSRWKSLVETATVSCTVSTATGAEVDAFTQYAFELPPIPKSGAVVDTENRLLAAAAAAARGEGQSSQPPAHIVAEAVGALVEGRDSTKTGGRRAGGRRRAKKGGSDAGDGDAPPSVKGESPPPGGGGGGYSTMTLKQLQDLCKKHGLSTGGKKTDLAERLDVFDATSKPKRK